MKLPKISFALVISTLLTGFVRADGDRAYIPDTKVPEIKVLQPAGNNLQDGATKISFGEVPLRTSSRSKTFTIKNTGLAKLTGIAITRSGANRTLFTVSAPGKTSLAPGATTTFTVKFRPVLLGTKEASIHISSNDSDESPFDIRLTGKGVEK